MARHLGKVKRSAAPSLAALSASLILALTGCSGEESPSDTASPDHMIKAPKSQGKYRFGITDTVAVEFSEDIDTAALAFQLSDTAGIGHRILSRRKAILFGTRSTYGASHFPVNTPFVATLTGLRDLAGNGHPSIDAPFAPWPWVDRDYLDTTYDWYDSLFNADAWIDGTPVTDTLLIEGSLDYKQNFGRVDRLDYKVLRVAAPDTVQVFLMGRRDVNIRMQVAGPFKPAGFDTVLAKFDFDAGPTTGEGTRILGRDSTAGQGRASRTFVTDLKDHKRVLDSFDAAGYYVIRLGVPEGREGFYRLGLRIRKF